MPIFDFRCSKCGYEVEIFQKVGESSPNQCPECKSDNSMHKRVSAPRFQLSGGGWYETLEKPKDKQRNVVRDDSDPSKTS